MLHLSYDDIRQKILDNGSITEADLDEKINKKLSDLAGLISKEGAAHIVANELGINMGQEAQAKARSKVNELSAGDRNVEIVGKVLNVYEVREFERNGRSGKVGSFFMGDETGRIRITCWGTQADTVKDLKEGDIVKLANGMVRENNGFKEIHMNDQAAIEKNPEGESVEVSASQKTMRRKIQDLSPDDQNVEIFGHVVQVFDPRFYEVCPQCGKRIRDEGGVYNCPEHGQVEPDYGYLVNFVCDDGSGNIRVVMFRKQVETFLGKDKETIMTYRTQPETFAPIKNDLLGDPIKLRGKASHNQMFDRMEFVAFNVDTNPDPKEEMNRMES